MKFDRYKYFGDNEEIISKIIAIVIGCSICSFAVNAFFIPMKLLSGGVGGISIIVQLLSSVPAGITLFALNMPIFLFGIKELDKKFLMYAFISTFVLSLSMIIFNGIYKYIAINDILLCAVFGGALNGLGMGILFRYGACQGGLDIIAAVCKKKYNINIGSALMTMNAIIISVASSIFGPEKGLYTIISMFIAYKVLDKVQLGFKNNKTVIIISKNYEELSISLMNKLQRGATLVSAQGAWSGENMKLIYIIVSARELVHVKKICREKDPAAVLAISDTTEVKGRGFEGKENF